MKWNRPVQLLKTSLRYFEAAIRLGSIRKAAEQLHVASSAVNRQLLLLEQEMGVELFERLPRGIRPTAAGETLLTQIKRWDRETTLLMQEIGGRSEGVRGTIRMAISETFIDNILPRAMRRLQAHFPRVDYTLVSGDTYRMINELLTQDADIVIAYDVGANIRVDVVHSEMDPIGVIVVPDHPLAGRDFLKLEDCAPYPVVAPGGQWLSVGRLNALFNGEREFNHIVVHAERPGMVTTLVEGGLGIAFMSFFGVERAVSAGRLVWIPLEPGLIEPSRVTMLGPRRRPLPTYLSLFIDILKAEFIDYARMNSRWSQQDEIAKNI